MESNYLRMGWCKLRLPFLVLLCSLLSVVQMFAQGSINVRGVVTDEKQEPLIGVTIQVKGSSKGASTGLDGDFSLQGVPSNATLIVSYVGMERKEVAVAGKTELAIVLKSLAETLDEQVVVAYGRQKKVNLTGSVSSLDSKALEARPVANVSQALQGLVPGLNLSVNNAGGELNSAMSINIRGEGTIGSGSSASPLVLIDGVEGNMNSLSASDIESISVLKDAASSAIYGSRAAFGVILITTKSGREGKTRVNYSGNVRFTTATQVPDMMDSERFALYWNRASANSGGSPIFNDEALKKIQAYKSGNFGSNPEWAAGTQWNETGRYWTQYSAAWANTNWFEEMYKSNVPSTEHTLSVSGGTAKLNYYLSGAYLGQKGLIRHGEDVFKRYNFTGKLSADITDWLRADYTQRWVREDYTRPSYMTGLFFHNIARRWPTNAVRDANGNLVYGNETIQMERGGINDNQTDRVNHQLNFVIKPFEDLSIHLESAYNTTYYNNHQSILPTYGHDGAGAPYYANRDDNTAGHVTQVTEQATKNMYFNGRYYAQWGHIFGKKHDVRLNVGMDIEENRYRNLSGNKRDLITPSIATINTATNSTPGLNGGYSHWSTMGVFGRVNYVYDDRYLAEVSLRHNGSSRFIGDKTWGTFPAVSLGWNIANEAFFAPLKDKVSMLKLRASWGALGNTNTTSLYPWFLSLPVTPGGITQGSIWMVNGQRQMISNAPGLVSNRLTWERVESWNLGLDWAAFRNRFQGSLDVYSRSTKDMVGPASPVSSILGASLPPQNNSDLRSYGWELELRWRDQIGDLKYGAKFVLADSQVEITKFYNPTGTLDTWYEGGKMGDIWGYKTAGLAKSDEEMTAHLANNRPTWGNNWAAGDLMYLDLNGDKEVSAKSRTINDHGDLTVIGNTTPRYTYSLNLDAAYKGFDFSVLFQGVMKKDFWDNSPYSIGANTGMWQSVGFNDHWDFFRPEGDPLGANLDAHFPRPLFASGGKNFQTNDRYLQSAAYMRIKNIQLGYTLPTSLVSRLGLNSLRVYASADNLVTFTKMNKIFDPEATGGSWGSGKIYPLQRTVSFGLNVNL